jgi:hypothetical protein
MRVAVVYESLFGNTREVAEAIAAGIREALPGTPVECRSTGDAAPALGEVGLLVVGGPTHFLGLPSARSRRMQHQQEDQGAWHHAGDEPAGPPGAREWLESLPQVTGRHPAAAFDTRLGKLMAGSAARQITRLLRRRGYDVLDRPQGFVVEDYGGPLAEGELGRARAWGATLAGLARPDTAASA